MIFIFAFTASCLFFFCLEAIRINLEKSLKNRHSRCEKLSNYNFTSLIIDVTLNDPFKKNFDLNSKSGQRNTIIGIGLLIVMSIITTVSNIDFQYHNSVPNNLTILVEQPFRNLVELELKSFDKLYSKDWKIKVRTAPEQQLIAFFEKNPEAIMILPNRLVEQELTLLNPNHLAIKQSLLATGMVESSTKELYLICNANLLDKGKLFVEFLFSWEGQSILLMEGYIPAKFNVY